MYDTRDKKIIVTNHAVERFNERARTRRKRKGAVIKEVIRDLTDFRRIRKITNKESNEYLVFTRGFRRYSVIEKKGRYVVTTMVQQSKNRNNMF